MSKRPSELVDHFVYRAWDAEGGLLYVGCSMNLRRRLKEHRMYACWYAAMASITFDGPYSYAVARNIEREATRTEEPRHNQFAPAVLAVRRKRLSFYDAVMLAAIQNGQSYSDAITQASIATALEFDEAAA